TVEMFAGAEAADRDPETGTEAAGTEGAGTEAADRADRTARFSLVGDDALKVSELPAPVSGGEANRPDLPLANLPHNVPVPVLLHSLETLPSRKTVLGRDQLEVADRLAAAPGSRTYGVPSVKAQWFGDVRQAGRIGKNVFWPAPNIDSGLVRIDVTRTDRHPVQRRRLFSLLDAAFA